jgi:putative membrane protein
MYGFDHGVWMMGGWMVVLLLWLLPFTLLFVALKIFFDKFKAVSGKSALDILEEAYAGGNISREEFMQKRDDLQKK